MPFAANTEDFRMKSRKARRLAARFRAARLYERTRCYVGGAFLGMYAAGEICVGRRIDSRRMKGERDSFGTHQNVW